MNEAGHLHCLPGQTIGRCCDAVTMGYGVGTIPKTGTQNALRELGEVTASLREGKVHPAAPS